MFTIVSKVAWFSSGMVVTFKVYKPADKLETVITLSSAVTMASS